MTIDEILASVRSGKRMSENEACMLLEANGSDIWRIADAADQMRKRICGDTVTFVRNMNIHVTNICKNRCGLCAFGTTINAPDAYMFSDDEFRGHLKLAIDEKVTEVCYLAGIHPSFTIDSYINIIKAFHEEIPNIHVHGCSPDEILFAATRSSISTKEALIRLKEAGLNSVQGTAAEILDDAVRKIICERKLSVAEWIRIIKEAAELGFKATSTIMYGSVETVQQRAHHLQILRDIQDETNVFTELVPLSFLHKNTPLEKTGIVHHGAFGRNDILMIAVSRLFLDNIKNIQVPWTKVGLKMAQLCLCAGGNDLGGTMYSDSLSRSAGADEEADFCSPEDMVLICADINRPLKQRDTLYHIL